MAAGPVDRDEDLTRFIFQSGSLRPSDNSVKAEAFYPRRSNGLCSVVVLTGTEDDAVREYARTYVVPARGPLYAWATVPAAVPLDEGLGVVYLEPPPNHANISGYAPEKEKMMAQALVLASKASAKKA